MADAGPQLVGKGALGFVFLWLVRMGGVGQLGMKICRVGGERDVGMVSEEKVLPYLKEVNVYIKACGQQSVYSTGK